MEPPPPPGRRAGRFAQGLSRRAVCAAAAAVAGEQRRGPMEAAARTRSGRGLGGRRRAPSAPGCEPSPPGGGKFGRWREPTGLGAREQLRAGTGPGRAGLQGAEAGLAGRCGEGKVPGGPEIGGGGPGRRGGGEQLYPAKHVYSPCLHVGKIQAPYGFSGGSPWLLASPRVSLE